MAGKWSTINPEQCAHYARFMSHLTLAKANVTYWFLFFAVLFMMVLCAVEWHNMTESLKETEKKFDEEHGTPLSPDTLRAMRRRNRKAHRRSANVVCTCLILVIGCAIVECFALFNIEFCDGEDLMFLYWGFWSVLTMGSLIAILGVAVQFWIVLSSVKNPAWAVALGTPVLVFAAIGWVVKHQLEVVWAKIKGQKLEETEFDSDDDEKDDEDEGSGVDRWFSRAPTIIGNQQQQPADANSSQGVFGNNTLQPNGPRRSSTF